MKVEQFPIGEIPYEAVNKLMSTKGGIRSNFIPTSHHLDLKSGGVMELVYWYPEYIDELFEAVVFGKEWRMVLFKYHVDHVQNFEKYFPSIVRKLERIRTQRLKLNHLDETAIGNGRVK